jgi:sulfite exporter TauE/SafE
MAAFGIGTLPSMFLAAFGAQRFAGLSARPAARRIAGFALLASAVLTLAGPWLPPIPWLHACLPFACRTPE